MKSEHNTAPASPRVRPAPSQRSPRLSGRNDLSFSTCVKTLSNVAISRRGLLQLELAVGLAIFMDAGVANKSSKNMLNEIYYRAGYDCDTSEGKDYKTVNRRIQASAGLYGKLGQEVITGWVMDQKESKLLQTIGHKLAQFEFNSLDDVLDYIGRTSNRTTASRGPNPFDIEVGDITVHLPKKMTEAQLVELASKILALAEAVKEEEKRLAEIAAAEEAEEKGEYPAVERRKKSGPLPEGVAERRVTLH